MSTSIELSRQSRKRSLWPWPPAGFKISLTQRAIANAVQIKRCRTEVRHGAAAAWIGPRVWLWTRRCLACPLMPLDVFPLTSAWISPLSCWLCWLLREGAPSSMRTRGRSVRQSTCFCAEYRPALPPTYQPAAIKETWRSHPPCQWHRRGSASLHRRPEKHTMVRLRARTRPLTHHVDAPLGLDRWTEAESVLLKNKHSE